MILSIDPGIKGAVVIWNDDDSINDILNMKYNGSYIDYQWLNKLMKLSLSKLIVEDVHTAPRSGVSSAGSFMYSLGCIHAAADAAGVEIVKLRPQTWKNTVGLYKKPKIKALDRVVEFFGTKAYNYFIGGNINRVDRAEAVLIGYAYQKLQKHGMV